VSDLPTGWARTPVSALGELRLGKMLDKAKNRGQPAQYLRNVNVRWFRFDVSDLQEIRVDERERTALSIRDGDLMICEGGEPGRCAVWKSGPSSFVYQKALHRFRSNGSIDPRFLMYQLKHLASSGELQELFTGTTIKHLTRESLARLEVLVPPLAEQKRIADKLDRLLAAVDTCKTRLDAIPTILKRFRQSVLAAATSGELTEEWRENNGVAFNWKESDLQAVATIGTGSTPLRSNSAFYSVSGTPWVTSAATAQPIVRESIEYVTDAAITEYRLRKYPIGTLLVAMYGEGKTRGQVTELGIEATINQACAAIVVDAKKVEPRFVKLSLQANYFQMRELAEGGNQPNLNLSKIKEFPLVFPLDMREQIETACRADGLFAYADRVESWLTTARTKVECLASSLLAKAFRCELISQDPNSESAVALAASIPADGGSSQQQPIHVSKEDQSKHRLDHVCNH